MGAEQTLKIVLKGFDNALGKDDPQTLTCMHQLGVALQAQQKLKDAERYMRKALTARKRTLGTSHADTKASTQCLVGILKLRIEKKDEHTFEALNLDTEIDM